MRTSRKVVSAGAALCVAMGGTCPAAGASPVRANTLTLSGQLNGSMSVNTSLTCRKGNLGASNGVSKIVALTLKDKSTKPTSGYWEVEIDFVHAGTTKLVVPNNAVGASFTASSREKVVYDWVASSGTFTISSNFKEGTFSLTMKPYPLPTQAKGKETLVGSWDCN
jgi:hypothetical protein